MLTLHIADQSRIRVLKYYAMIWDDFWLVNTWIIELTYCGTEDICGTDTSEQRVQRIAVPTSHRFLHIRDD